MIEDFFFFREREKKALTLLLVVALAAWWWLAYSSRHPSPTPQESLPTDTASVAQQPRDSVGQRPFVAEKKKAAPRKKPFVSSNEFRKTKSLYKRRASYTRIQKLPQGSVVELNTADTTLLKQVPGIGTTFARRIVGFRRLLGGYASVSQLQEVYGLNPERYAALKGWFRADTSRLRRLDINALPMDSLARHPYINYRQARAISRLVRQKGRIYSWEMLRLLEEFSPEDEERLRPYLVY